MTTYIETWEIVACARGHREMRTAGGGHRGAGDRCARCMRPLDHVVDTADAVIVREKMPSGAVIETLMGRA